MVCDQPLITVESINGLLKGFYDSGKIHIDIKKTMITNDYETTQIIEMSRGLVSESTLLTKHPFVDDVYSELENLKEEETEEAEKTNLEAPQQ